MSVNEIRQAVCEFKKSIENVLPFQADHEFRKFKRFPEGCCVLTSHLLSRFLVRELSMANVRVIHGEYLGFWHYWVECEGKVFDITMNQKAILLEDVIFQDSGWHKKFRILEVWDVSSTFEYINEGADRACISTLESAYELIIRSLNHIKQTDNK